MAAPVKLTRWMRWRRSIACALIVALLLAFGLPALVASSALVALAVSSVDVVAATIVIVDTLAAIAVALGAQGAASSCARRLARRPGLVARGSGAWLQSVLGAIFLAALVSPVAAMDSPATTVHVAASLAMAAGVATGVAAGAASAAAVVVGGSRGRRGRARPPGRARAGRARVSDTDSDAELEQDNPPARSPMASDPPSTPPSSPPSPSSSRSGSASMSSTGAGCSGSR